jgi:protein-tyrosine phosphatase
MPFSVLYVCTGNVCRSPMAELLFRAWADPRAEVTVHSAGMQALVGRAIDGSSASALGQLGIDTSQHRGKQFEPWMATQADLILTAERAHRDTLMTELPAIFRRTFTMKEFARLAPYVTAMDAAGSVAQASASRAQVGIVTPEQDDVADPFKTAVKRAKSVAEEITENVRTTLDMLRFSPRYVSAGRPMPYRVP